MRAVLSPARRLLVALALAGAVAGALPAAVGAAAGTAVFSKAHWKVGVGGLNSVSGQPFHSTTLGPNATFQLCTAGDLAAVTISFHYAKSPGRVFDRHGHLKTPFHAVFKTPEGSRKLVFATDKAHGLFELVYPAFELPGHTGGVQTPVPTGTFSFTATQGRHTLLRMKLRTSVKAC